MQIKDVHDPKDTLQSKYITKTPTTTPSNPVPLSNAKHLSDPLPNSIDDGLKSCIVIVFSPATDVVGVG
jgi:hypothetical protein